MFMVCETGFLFSWLRTDSLEWPAAVKPSAPREDAYCLPLPVFMTGPQSGPPSCLFYIGQIPFISIILIHPIPPGAGKKNGFIQ